MRSGLLLTTVLGRSTQRPTTMHTSRTRPRLRQGLHGSRWLNAGQGPRYRIADGEHPAVEAVKHLRYLLTIPAGEYISVARLKIDPVWDPIRNDPGFQKLLSEPEPETVYR
jgi:hypothetical protein